MQKLFRQKVAGLLFLTIATSYETSLASPEVATIREDFEDGMPGKFPPRFFVDPHFGNGYPGSWVVLAKEGAPSGRYVLSQIVTDDTYTRLLPLPHQSAPCSDADVQVKFMQISGREDRIAGLMVRYQDPQNYIVGYANSNALGIRLYKMFKGEYRQIAAVYNIDVISGNWYTLRLEAVGPNFKVYWNERLMFTGYDKDITVADKTGIFTKSDSVSLFDDFESKCLDAKN